MKDAIVFGLYGASDSGKTSLIVKIIKKLTDEGFKVATVKITDKKIGMDTRGKDTWKYSKAGSKLVVLSTPIETSFIVKEKKDLDTIIKNICTLGSYDIILVEGANTANIPKIRLGDIKERKNTIFTYDEDYNRLYKMIKNEIIRRKEMKEINIKVNGKPIKLTEFPAEIIKNTICGMLKSLKGVDKIKDVEIRFVL